MRIALCAPIALLTALSWTAPADAQVLIVDDQAVQEHFTLDATTYVSLEVMLRAAGFDWSLSGGELVLTRGSGQGPRIDAPPEAIKLGGESFIIDGVLQGDIVYVPLHDLVQHLGFQASRDLDSNTLTVAAAARDVSVRVRIGREQGEQPAIRIRIGGGRRGAGDQAGVTHRQPAILPSEPLAADALTLWVEDEKYSDMPMNWVTKRILTEPVPLTFEWTTHDPEAAAGTWWAVIPKPDPISGQGMLGWLRVPSVLQSLGEYFWRVPVYGSAGAAPAPGDAAHFTIDLRQILPKVPPSTPITLLVWVQVDAPVPGGADPEPIGATSPVMVVYARDPTLTIPEGLP